MYTQVDYLFYGGKKMRRKVREMHSVLAVFMIVILLSTTIFPAHLITVYASEPEKSDTEQDQADTEVSQERTEQENILDVQHDNPSQLKENEDFTLHATIPEATNIMLVYKKGETTEKIPMDQLSWETFTATIPGTDIQTENLEYRFEEEKEGQIKTSLPYIVEVIEEIQQKNQNEDESKETTTDSQESTKKQTTNNDLQPEVEEQQESFTIEHEPITEIRADQDLTLEANVPQAVNVTLKFRTANQMEVQEVPFTQKEGTDSFSVQVPSNYFWSPNFQYQIRAEAEDGTIESTEYIDSTVNFTNTPDTQTIPQLLITEITPASDKISGSDAYEFIEIYNNSNQPIKIEDYNLIYQSPTNTTDQTWDLTEDKEIRPQESFIVWVHNNTNNHLTIEDFNLHYGTTLTENQVTIINNGGMTNDSETSLVISDNYDNEISKATYKKNDVHPNQGIVYQYPANGNTMKNVGISETVTPTVVLPGQVPNESVTIVNNGETPNIGKPRFSVTNDAITVEVEVASEQEILNVQLFYSQSDAIGFESITMQASGDSTYTLSLPLQYIWSDNVQYYFVANNAAGETKTETDDIDIPQPDYDSQTVPRLLITEMTPDTVNMNGSDAYEFIEIYNNSNQPINIKDYKFVYRYPTSTPDQTWDLTEDKEIGPQESFIVWIHNEGNKDATLNDFNEAYGLNLPESHVTIIENGGMANGSERTMVLADDFDNVITEASYNDGSDDVFTDRGIIYKFPTDGNIMQKVGVATSVSPLTVYPEQVPSEPVQMEADADGETPEIGQATLEIVDEAIQIQVEVESEQSLNGVNFHYSQSETLGYETISLFSENDGIYTASIPLEDIWNDRIDYHIIASNQAGQTASESAYFEIPQETVDYQDVPPLLITEVVPDSANANGADAYEFIEIYNNTTEAINFNDYTIRYRYPNTGAEGDVLWGPPIDHKDIIIPSGETIVLWIINSGNPHMAGTDFNSHYGTDLTEGTNLIKIFNNGMSNSAERTLVIATKTGYELSKVHYNEVNGVKDTVADKGILYRFPKDGETTSTKISAGETGGTPGTVMAEQVPAEKVSFPADETAPVIEDKTNNDAINSEASFQVTATITDDIQVKSVFLYYRTIEGTDFIKVSLERGSDNTFQHTIYQPELIGQNELEYYFVASDGENQTTTETNTIPIEHPNEETGLRLNVQENELISGEKVIKATEDEYNEDMQLFLDNEQVTDTFMAMENEAYFAFDVTETNIFFQNGVTMGDEILEIFDDTYTNFVTLTVPIPANKLQTGDNTISIRAGNKVSPFDEKSAENRDDFTMKNVRLVLSDGTIIYDPEYNNPSTQYPVGDSTGKESVFDFTFTLEQDKFASLAYLFDTTTVADGSHEVKAVLDEEKFSTTVITDNTVPTIKPSVEDGAEYKGEFTIDADVQDASSIDEMTTTLDGNFISLPHKTSSALLEAGEHEAVFTATDAAGNVETVAVTFTVAEEHPWLPDWLEHNPDSTSANLSVRVTDPTGDPMDVGFNQGYQYTAEDKENLSISQHAVGTEPPQEFAPEGETALTEAELNQLTSVDGEEVSTESTTEFPYHRFDITVDPAVSLEDEIEIVWNGSSLEGRKVTMYAWNHTLLEWEALTSVIAGSDAFELVGTVQGADYVQDGKVSVIVQDQIAAPGEDFSFVWFTDTQYYAESYPWIYEDQVNWIVENQDELNIEYVFHTGDLVNIYDDFDQWEIADRNMRLLDDAGIPNGVLAGNHDVDMKNNDYVNYYKYFGADRYEDRSYYGGTYENNRGHYDLISVNGNDFIMLYMGWGVDQAGIDWMNEVLAAHPNRTAILSLHEYLLASGTRSPIGDEVFEKVVVPNENVKAVLAGHYHNAQTYIDEIDDNGDGITDRTVYQMLADYQGGPEGGQGYLRILNFNMGENTVDVQTYSPYLDDFNYYDAEEYPGKDEFTMNWNLEPQMKRVATDYVEVNVYTNEQIGSVENVPSGEAATVVWDDLDPEREYFWYAVASDAYGGSTRSEIWNFETVEGEIVVPDEDLDKDEESDGDDGTDENPDKVEESDKDGGKDEINDEQDVSTDDSLDKNDDSKQPTDSTNDAEKQFTPNNQNEDKNKIIERATDHHDGNQNELPSTATNIYNLLVAGLILMIIGAGLWFVTYYRKKRLVDL